MTNAPLLEIDGVTVTYKGRGSRRTGPVALNDVSFAIGPGETVGLVGESGSGKSTLANVVLGLVQQTSGRIIFDGTDISSYTTSQRRRLSSQIQAVFQDPYSTFNPNLTIGDSVGETLRSQGIGRSELRDRVGTMLERVGIGARAMHNYPSQFSGGQRQRIAIARALLPSPRLVVCDEAVSALDLSIQAQVLNLLDDLQKELGVSYLFITHDLGVVRHVAHRTVVLNHGVLVEQGTTEEIIDHPEQDYTRRLVESSLVADPDEQAIRRRIRRGKAAASTSV